MTVNQDVLSCLNSVPPVNRSWHCCADLFIAVTRFFLGCVHPGTDLPCPPKQQNYISCKIGANGKCPTIYLVYVIVPESTRVYSQQNSLGGELKSGSLDAKFLLSCILFGSFQSGSFGNLHLLFSFCFVLLCYLHRCKSFLCRCTSFLCTLFCFLCILFCFLFILFYFQIFEKELGSVFPGIGLFRGPKSIGKSKASIGSNGS